MSYATIMVHVEGDVEADSRTGLAAKLVDVFQSELIGINAWMPRPRPVIDPDSSASEFHYLESESQKIVERFRTKLAVNGRKVSLRFFLEFPTECIAREMRAADLLVIGREFGVNDPYLYPDTAALILKIGRPVLAVPPGMTTLSGKRVVVAWKDTREARRAVNDALPFLLKAEQIIITEICEHESEFTESQHRLRDVAQHLSRHGVRSVVDRVLPLEGTAANSLVDLVKETSSDLIVAGAYGHSRLGEWMFGGVTQDLVAHSPVCCLFSH